MKTIATFAAPEDYALESEVMNAHQKASIGNFLIKKTMGLYYKVPEDFEQLVYLGLVLQGQANASWNGGPSPQPSLLYGYALLAVE